MRVEHAHAPRPDDHEPHRREKDHDEALDELALRDIESRRDEPCERRGGEHTGERDHPDRRKEKARGLHGRGAPLLRILDRHPLGEDRDERSREVPLPEEDADEVGDFVGRDECRIRRRAPEIEGDDLLANETECRSRRCRA